MATMINRRFRNNIASSNTEDNFEILKLSVTGKQSYKDVDWTFICDKSGSMATGRLSCLKYTLNKMLDYFYEDSKEKNNNHYVHIITFNQKASGFDLVVNKEADIQEMQEKIDKINADGMTNIGIAFDKFDKTEYSNEVSCHNILFMSDGEITTGIYNSDILKKKFQDKLDVLKNNTPICIGYGNGHDISFMEKMADVANGEYHCIESTEGAGVVYGEVLHSCLNEYCRSSTLVLENGRVYDYKTNSWVQTMNIGRLVSDKELVWHVKRDDISKPVSASIIGINANKEKILIVTSEIIEPEDDTTDKEVEKYMLRQKTQELLAEARDMHDGNQETNWMNGIPPPPAIPRSYGINRIRAPSLSNSNIQFAQVPFTDLGAFVPAPPPAPAALPVSPPQLGQPLTYNTFVSQEMATTSPPKTPTSPLSGNVASPPPYKRQRACCSPLNTNDSIDSDNEENKVLSIKTPKSLLIDRMNTHLNNLKTYIKDNGDEDGFVAMLCDDTYVGICGLRSSNGKHYIVARQVSQGSQRAYMASDLGELDVDVHNVPNLTPHSLSRAKTTPYASQQVSQVIRSVTDS